MSINIPVHYVKTYVNNVEMLLSQQGGTLQPLCTYGTYVGKEIRFIEQIGPIQPQRNLPRNSPTPLMNTVDDNRWVAPADYDAAVLIDRQDRVRMLLDPQGGYTTAMVEGHQRSRDDEIMAAFFGPARTGEEGTTIVNYPTTWDVAVDHGAAGPTGLNVAKLQRVQRYLMANGVKLDKEEVHMIIDSVEHENLLNEVQIVNKDYNNTAVLVNGRVTRFMGINFHHVEFLDAASYPFVNQLSRMKDVAGSQVWLPAWVKSGMHFGDWQSLEVDVGPRRDLRNNQQILTQQVVGASRVQEGKIIRVRCNRTFV